MKFLKKILPEQSGLHRMLFKDSAAFGAMHGREEYVREDFSLADFKAKYFADTQKARKIIYVNGKIGGGSPPMGFPYWNSGNEHNLGAFCRQAADILGTDKHWFARIDHGYLSGSIARKLQGEQFAKDHLDEITSGMSADQLSFVLIAHSMGSAFAEGIGATLQQLDYQVICKIYINTFQAGQFAVLNYDRHGRHCYTIDYQNTNDPVIHWAPNAFAGELAGAHKYVRRKAPTGLMYVHRFPLDRSANFWEDIFND